MVELLLFNNADANQEDHDRWTTVETATQEGHLIVIKYLSVGCGHTNMMKDMDGITLVHASQNTDHSSSRIQGTLCIDDCFQIATRQQQHEGRRNAISAALVKASFVDPETQPSTTHTEQSKPDMHNIHHKNESFQADIENEGCAELSLKTHLTEMHYDEDDDNGESSPVFSAHPKSPNESIQTNTEGLLNTPGPQTWQYNRFGPPCLLWTLNTVLISAELSDLKSPWPPFTEQIGHTREFSILIVTRKDCYVEGASLKSNSILVSKPSPVAHQDVYSKQYFSHATALSTKISEHRNASTGLPPTILLFLQTFLQMILVLSILLAGFPVNVRAAGITEEITLQAGSRGVVPFHLPSSQNNTFQGFPYYVFRFESQDRPFCINGERDVEGFKSQDQLSRFNTSVIDSDTSPYVNLIIDNVETLDQDVYIFKAIFFRSLEHVQYETVKKNIVVQIPHGPAKCFITVSGDDEFPYEVHCRASSGSAETSLSCYHNGQKLHSRNSIADDGQETRGIFFLPFDTRFACCSHVASSFISAATCSDFEWPPRKHFADTTTRIASTRHKSVNITSLTSDSPLNFATSTTTMTTQMKYSTDSAARRPFIYPSLLYLSLWSYLSMHVLSAVY
ncbi:uncharacterized protein LOC121412580 [Lytechinus variegatus]|uniref:uncharacterized protein LOC121412580 n=1 Tax=Lytechinus variegatus TaxID=7654 RepID=UPI001BB28B1C|nr:uncharacterized protein LOC121412580 [Lytechinus variegatus]